MILPTSPGDQSWPITASTFILMHKEPADKAASAEAVKFFTWAFAKGGKMAEELDYIPMPEPVVKLIERPGRLISRAEGRSGLMIFASAPSGAVRGTGQTGKLRNPRTAAVHVDFGICARNERRNNAAGQSVKNLSKKLRGDIFAAVN